jgi:serine/threonine-protein kinase HipA
MRKAHILINGVMAGVLEELTVGQYRFSYQPDYQGAPVSLTMPVEKKVYEFNQFPPFFEGLLPEGIYLEALLRKYKLDKNDYFAQLLQVGNDLVGAVTVLEIT